MITGVAVRNPETGEVRSLPRPARHHNLFRAFNDEPSNVEWYRSRGMPTHEGLGWDDDEIGAWEQGFVTDSGVWLSRHDAFLHAQGCRQPRRLRGDPWCVTTAVFDGSEGPPIELFSEDLW